uniref:Uncharacterized protein n=1 Tax=Xenopus tropicalis TaxID=8364 RepID=A0A6I8R885_XENTR
TTSVLPRQKEMEGSLTYGNIMYHRRLVQGHTHTFFTYVTFVCSTEPPVEIQRQQEELLQPRTPDSEEGRHIDMCPLTLGFEKDMKCHTKVFSFIPAKTRAATQILEGELFDFKLETIKQALREVMEEEELAQLRAQQSVLKSCVIQNLPRHSDYLVDLVSFVFCSLRENGYFYDPVERDVAPAFMPWLMKKVENIMKKNDLVYLLKYVLTPSN